MKTPDTAPQQVKPEDIEALIEVFQASDWDEMHLTMGEFEIFLSNDPNAAPQGAAPAPAPAPAALAASAASAAAPGAAPALAAPAPAAGGPASAGAEDVPAHWQVVSAPNLGTFYRAPKPGAANYCEVGQSVTADSELCLIEVMKLFTALRGGIAGTVRRICVADGEMVEYGQPLFYIEPA
ncbi:MAG: acetyl-CoA carboxylase, biotin carboxyl carrier protein [Pararhodobacter sp.]|nr:acetyl-CoA carboxylase, biotin carboxyl carrier protein [Pararhodobacter sp.]